MFASQRCGDPTSQLPQKSRFHRGRKPDTVKKCGSGLARECGGSAMNLLTDTLHSRASPLPHLDLYLSGRQWSALAFDLGLRRPVKPRWPNAGLNPWVTRQDVGLAALGQGWPIAAALGFKPSFGHTEPKRGAEWWGKSLLLTFGLFPKVSRRKGGTHISHHPNNGYVLNQKNAIL